MASTTSGWTLAELLEQFGPIPASRIRHDPAPGLATEQDVIDIESREDRLYELVDGVLLEKVMGYYESFVAGVILRMLANFVMEHDLGVVTGADGTVKLLLNQVRIPDVSFVAWDQLPNRKLPAEPIPQLAPNLAVEVISEGNTPREMERKLDEYFRAGVQLVWYVYPKTRTVRVFTATDQMSELSEDEVLQGGAALPGFELPLAELFALPQASS